MRQFKRSTTQATRGQCCVIELMVITLKWDVQTFSSPPSVIWITSAFFKFNTLLLLLPWLLKNTTIIKKYYNTYTGDLIGKIQFLIDTSGYNDVFLS